MAFLVATGDAINLGPAPTRLLHQRYQIGFAGAPRPAERLPIFQPQKVAFLAGSRYPDQSAHELGLAMKNGMYLVTTKGFDGVEWPPGGVFFLLNGVLLGGGSFMYFVGSYTLKEGTFKGECVANPHTPPPANHLYFKAKDVGVGFVGTYEGDQAELTATVLLGKRSLTLHATLRKLADI